MKTFPSWNSRVRFLQVTSSPGHDFHWYLFASQNGTGRKIKGKIRHTFLFLTCICRFETQFLTRLQKKVFIKLIVILCRSCFLLTINRFFFLYQNVIYWYQQIDFRYKKELELLISVTYSLISENSSIILNRRL